MLRVNTVDTVAFDIAAGSAVPVWLSAALGIDPWRRRAWCWRCWWAAAWWCGRWPDADFRTSANNLLAGLGIGAVIAAMWWVIGHLGFVAEHPETLDAVYLAPPAGAWSR